MPEQLTATQIIGMVLGVVASIILMPSIVKLAAQAVPFLAEVVSDIFNSWLETWREAIDEIKKIFKR